MWLIFALMNLAQGEELSRAATVLWSYSESRSPKQQLELLARLREIPSTQRLNDLNAFVADEEARRQSHVGRLTLTEPDEIKAVDDDRLRLAYRALIEAHEDLYGDAGLLALTNENLKPKFEDELYAYFREILGGPSRFARAEFYRRLPWSTVTILIEKLIHHAPADDDLHYLHRLTADTGRLMRLVYNLFSRLHPSEGLEAATQFLISTATKNKNWDALNEFAHEQFSRNDSVLSRAAVEAIRTLVQDPSQRRARAYYADLPFYERELLVKHMFRYDFQTGGDPELLLELGSVNEMWNILSHLRPQSEVGRRDKAWLEEKLLAKRDRQRAFQNLPKHKRALVTCNQFLQKVLFRRNPPAL